MIELKVRFIKRLYGTSESNFSVFAAIPASRKYEHLVKKNKYGNFSISGDFSLDDNELDNVYTVTIEEDVTSRYDSSYKLIKLHYELPESADEQWDYLLNSGVVPINIYFSIEREFSQKDKILDIIMKNPEKLTKVRGIGEKRAQLYQERIIKHKDRAVIFAEYGHIEGVGHSIIKLLVNWKPNVKDTIKAIAKDPFSLLEHESIGFVIADRFRAHYGLPLNDRNRILHGVSYYLGERFQSTGNTYENIYEAVEYVSTKLLVSYKEILLLLAEMQDNADELMKYRLKIFGKNITTISLFNAELLIYQKTQQMTKDKQQILDVDKWKANKEERLSRLDNKVSDEQSLFLDMINDERILVLLGPGGSGKSWLTKIACDLIKEAGLTYGLYAPTARAAHVMSDYTSSPASTIHRGLMSYAMMNEVAPQDVIIIDEFSMVDSELASIVMRTIGTRTRLIIIGDDFQLQSVGPGNVLFDLVNFLNIPTIKFTKIFRQEEGNKILDYADDLRAGEFSLPLRKRISNPDIEFIHEIDDKKQKEIAVKLYKETLDKGIEDIMLLSPINNGVSGRRNLNKEIQAIVNPQTTREEIVFGANLDNELHKRYFRVNDYITVTKNQYEMIDDNDQVSQIINGDLGEVEYIRNNKLTFRVDDHSYTIDKSEINEIIDHAWAITIHKSQGGQANTVIIVLPQNSYFMLNANMLYTAITRTQQKCYVIGNFEGINKSAQKQANLNRKTMIQLQTIK